MHVTNVYLQFTNHFNVRTSTASPIFLRLVIGSLAPRPLVTDNATQGLWTRRAKWFKREEELWSLSTWQCLPSQPVPWYLLILYRRCVCVYVFVSWNDMCQGLKSKLQLFPYNRGWETQPNSRGLYTHYKDSVIKGGRSPIRKKTRLLTMAHMCFLRDPSYVQQMGQFHSLSWRFLDPRWW